MPEEALRRLAKEKERGDGGDVLVADASQPVLFAQKRDRIANAAHIAQLARGGFDMRAHQVNVEILKLCALDRRGIERPLGRLVHYWALPLLCSCHGHLVYTGRATKSVVYQTTFSHSGPIFSGCTRECYGRNDGFS